MAGLVTLDHLFIVVSDLERPPADQEWGARHAWPVDPDGYPMSIFTPLDQPG